VNIPDGQLQVPRYDTVLLVVACCIACEFQDLSSEVFEDGSEIHYVLSSQIQKSHSMSNDVPGAPAPTRCA
jgi:hypothetical protein